MLDACTFTFTDLKALQVNYKKREESNGIKPEKLIKVNKLLAALLQEPPAAGGENKSGRHTGYRLHSNYYRSFFSAFFLGPVDGVLPRRV